MGVLNTDTITVGGPCKLTDTNGNVIYFEDDVLIVPNPKWRAIPSAVAGDGDDTLVDLTYTIKGRPKAVWNAAYQASLFPAALTNWATAGGRVFGAANNSLTIVGADGAGFTFTNAVLTKMPDLFLGLGADLYSDAEWTGLIGNGNALSDANAFYILNSTAWSQADYPAGHEEELCVAAWGAVSGWTAVYAEKGFKLTHELGLVPILQGNVTVDYRVNKYRGMLSFTPEQPTTAQLLAAFSLQGAGAGIGSRRSSNANDFVVTGASGLSVTLKSAGLNKGQFVFSNKANRHGEFAMITALQTPGTRLALV